MTASLDLPDRLAAPSGLQLMMPGASRAHRADAPAADDDYTSGSLMHARTAVERHEQNPIAWARRAQAEQGAGHDERAAVAAERALNLAIEGPAPAAAHAAITVLAATDRRPVLEAFLSDPRSADLPADIRLKAAIETGDLELARQLVKDNASPEALAVRVWLELDAGDPAAAVEAGRAAQRTGAPGPGVLMNIGYAHAALGNLAKAIKLTRQAAALAPRDRLVGFNLAGFLRRAGFHDQALAVLERLANPEEAYDIELALAIADVLAERGRVDAARRLLQGVRTSHEWVHADRVRRSELDANLALLRWMTDRERYPATVKALLRALGDSGDRSLSIAYLLPYVLRHPMDAAQLEKVLARLARLHPDDELLGLRVHHAVLSRNADDAVRYARLWAKRDLLNPTAAAHAIHLLTDLVGAYDEAGDIGLAALRRAPASCLLVNNTAYALSLAQRPVDAKRVLASLQSGCGNDVSLTATRALMEVVAGNHAAGERGYSKAVALAGDDEALATLVRLNHAMASGDHGSLPRDLRRDWLERPNFWISAHRLRREMGVELESLAAPAAH